MPYSRASSRGGGSPGGKEAEPGSPVAGGATGSAADQALLQRIRAEFHECGSSSGSTDRTCVSAEDLACYWERLAEEEQRRQGRPRLHVADQQAIALRVAQLMQEMDLHGQGRVSMEEWIHYMLLTRSGCATRQVNSLLDKALAQNKRILQDLQRMFEAADTTKSGVLSFREVVTMYSRKLWHLRPGNDRTHFITDAELNSGDPEQFARDIIQAMDLDGDEQISYSEFMAYSLGRRKQEVLLHIYDLSHGAAQAVSPWVVGRQLAGVWHTGTVVFGKEYYYAKDTVLADPGETSFGKPSRILHLGYTLWRQDEFHDFVIRELKPVFQRETYDVVCNNCNHFTDRVLMYLVGKHPPEEVMQQPEMLMKSNSVRVIRPVLNWWLRDRIVVREGMALPPGQKRLQPGERLPIGSVVYIHPLQGAAPPVLGQVAQAPAGAPAAPDSGRSLRSYLEDGTGLGSCGSSCGNTSALFGTCSLGRSCTDGRPGGASPEGVWVQFFDLALEPKGGCRGQARTELVQYVQLSPVGLAELKNQAIYNRAFKAMAGSRPPHSPGHGPRAGRGLVPHRVPVPRAMDSLAAVEIVSTQVPGAVAEE